jgi:signal transduction histidine kinase/ActR/RegA family two-component response regulator
METDNSSAFHQQQVAERVQQVTRGFGPELAEALIHGSVLADVSHVLSASLDEHETLATLARRLVPALADYCILDVFDAEGRIRRAAALHKDPARQELMREILHSPPEVGAATGMGRVLRTGQAVLTPEIGEKEIRAGARDDGHLRLLLELAPRSSILVPMISRGRVLGAICLALCAGDRRYGPKDLALAEEIGHRAALALDNARLYHEAQEAIRHRDESVEALRRLNEELAAEDRRKDEFLAMLAHELRNPLGAISNAGQVLDQTPSADPRVRGLGTVIGRQVRHLSRLVDDLLDVSRFTRGQIDLRPRPVELKPIVEGAVETTRPLLEQRGHRLTVALPEEPVRLEADATRIEQVLANLLHNAAKFTAPGGRIELTAETEDGQVVLRVRHNGHGIAPDLLPRIFDLFVQEDRSLARSHGGLGIGLTLVRTLVERHGGTVEAHSEGPGRGSEFVVRLPRLPGSILETPAAPLRALDEAAEHAPARVLLVEDNVDAAEALADLLRLWGHEVEVAHDGATAVRLARAGRPGVILLDIGLPGMDGYQVAAELRSLPDLQGALIVALTGYGQGSDRRRTAGAGFDHHLVKPVDLEELRRLVSSGGDRFPEQRKGREGSLPQSGIRVA